MCGSPDTRLVVIRGNSGPGQSSVARALRLRYGGGAALVEQDDLRRIMLREHDTAGAVNVDLIDQVTRRRRWPGSPPTSAGE